MMFKGTRVVFSNAVRGRELHIRLLIKLYPKHCACPELQMTTVLQVFTLLSRICPQVVDRGLNNECRPLESHRHETT